MIELLSRLGVIAICVGLIVSGGGPARADVDPRVRDAAKAAIACAPVAANPPVTTGAGTSSPAVFKGIDGGILCVKGNFYFDSAKKINAIPDPAAIKIMVIDSLGGFVLPAIQLANLAERNHWLIVISNNCYSSCANYVFLADTEKIVLPHSIVGWHGLPVSSATAAAAFEKEYAEKGVAELAGTGLTKEDARKDMIETTVQSERFYAAHKISEDLARSRPTPDRKFSPAYAEQYRQATAAGNITWEYSRHALKERWNVGKILYMWQPKDREAETAALKKRYGWWMFFFN